MCTLARDCANKVVLFAFIYVLHSTFYYYVLQHRTVVVVVGKHNMIITTLKLAGVYKTRGKSLLIGTA